MRVLDGNFRANCESALLFVLEKHHSVNKIDDAFVT